MAKRGMFTRKVTVTNCSVLCVDLTKKETVTKEVKIVGSYPDAKLDKLNKDLEEVVNTPELKMVTVISKVEDTKLYGMYEDDFLAGAVELDEKRNPIQ